MTLTADLLGDRALLLRSTEPNSLSQQQRWIALAQYCQSLNQCQEPVVGLNSLLLIFTADHQQLLLSLVAPLQARWQQLTPADLSASTLEIPVRYGGQYGPDLERVSQHSGLTPDQVIARHSEARYRVYCLGFQPGFAYLGGLPEELATPRQAEPRLRVPAGSVAIGGRQTGIYPAASPGGWNLIGQTTLPLFQLHRQPACLLQPGMEVRFVRQTDD